MPWLKCQDNGALSRHPNAKAIAVPQHAPAWFWRHLNGRNDDADDNNRAPGSCADNYKQLLLRGPQHGSPAACPELAVQCLDKCMFQLLPRYRDRAILTATPLRQQEYRDVNRAYSDVAQALAQYPSLSPRTDVHSMLMLPR